MQPTTTVQSLLLPTLIQQTTAQTSLPPVPSRIRDRIIRGEFIEFSTVGQSRVCWYVRSSESEPHKSLTLQLAPSGNDVAIHQTSNPKKITSFSSWMEAWNVYLSIRVDHAPTRATELVAYQCIIAPASTQYPPTAWLNYDVHFCMLAASDPNLHWDVRHTDLLFKCMTARSTQSACTIVYNGPQFANFAFCISAA